MSKNTRFRHLGQFFKFFVVGSFVATRTASGSADPEDALRHELAWTTVREGLSDVVSTSAVPGELRRLVEQEIDQDIDFRVNYTYNSIGADQIAQLDSLWMDHLVDRGVGPDDVDRFLVARTAALHQVVRNNSAADHNSEQLRNVVREFGRVDYSG